MHAALEFAYQHPSLFREWHEKSNYVCILAAKDEEHLTQLSKQLSTIRVVSEFREPDVGNQLTSLCIEPHEGNRKLLSCLPLAGRIKI